MKQLTSSPLALLSKRSVCLLLSHVPALICSLLVLIWTTEKLVSRSLSSQLFQQLTWWLCVDVWRGTCIKVSVPKRDCHSSSKGRTAPTFYCQFISQGHEAVSLFLYYFLKLSNCMLFCSKGGSFWKHQISCPFYAIIVCLRDELKALALLRCKFYVQHKVLTCLKSFLENTWKEPLCQGKSHTYHKLSLKVSTSALKLFWIPQSRCSSLNSSFSVQISRRGKGVHTGTASRVLMTIVSFLSVCFLDFSCFLSPQCTMHHAPCTRPIVSLYHDMHGWLWF